MDSKKKYEIAANALRILAIDMVQKANSGHPGLPLGAADIVTVLFADIMKYYPAKPTWANRDRFILSAGHGSALLYALLYLCGYDISIEDLKRFRQLNSITPGHPEYHPEIGIEMTTGPLGQGISTAVGIALAEKWLATRFNKPEYPIFDHYTYVLASDGDIMEGISHEAAALAGHLGLGKLIVLFDDNRITIDGETSLATSENVGQRFGAYGWHVQHVNGHDYSEIHSALHEARLINDKPSIILCRTHIGYKSPRQDTPKVHGEPLGEDGVAATRAALGWPDSTPFVVDQSCSELFVQGALRGKAAWENWQSLMAEYQTKYTDDAEMLEQLFSGRLPKNWDEELIDFTNEKPIATRAASGMVLEQLIDRLPNLIGGSADLSGSNKTRPKHIDSIQRDNYKGRYIHYGVREHGMGAIMNGLALHGLRPYGGTFLVFSDYMRPAIRLAALMGLPVIYVFTHDSIGLGEDGPTHQPVEHLAALRAIPNLVVIRPADGNETVAAWKVAIERKTGPTAIILSRQSLPQITPKNNDLKFGAYVLQYEKEEKPDVNVIATGSEVSVAVNVGKLLKAEGIDVRIVSMPSVELFQEMDEDYKKEVIPQNVFTATIEAGTTTCWQGILGTDNLHFGVDTFGASAPYKLLYKQFGLDAESVAKKILERLG